MTVAAPGRNLIITSAPRGQPRIEDIVAYGRLSVNRPFQGQGWLLVKVVRAAEFGPIDCRANLADPEASYLAAIQSRNYTRNVTAEASVWHRCISPRLPCIAKLPTIDASGLVAGGYTAGQER